MSRCHMIQQISVALQRGNAASVLGTIEQCNLIDNYFLFRHCIGGAVHCLLITLTQLLFDNRSCYIVCLSCVKILYKIQYNK